MELLDQTLPAIDRHLARGDVPLNKRAELAVIEFATHFIQAVQDEPSQEAVAPGQLHDFVRTRCFAKLYEYVHFWYRHQYGAAMERDRDDRLLGAVSITGTIFALRVPAWRSRPGQPGKTVWISFPEGIRENERPVDWIEAPPNLACLSPNELRAAEADAAEVADALRFIHTSLLVVSGSGNDDKLNGLRAGSYRGSNARRSCCSSPSRRRCSRHIGSCN